MKSYRWILTLFVLVYAQLAWAVNDTIPPVITMKPGTNGSIECYCTNSPYVDPGANAIDNLEGDITSRMVVSGTVNTRLPGDYKITYTVSDTSNNSKSVERTVRVRFTKFYERNTPYFVNGQLLLNTDVYTTARWLYTWDLDGIRQSKYDNSYTLVTNINDSLPHVVCINEKYCGYDTVFQICDTINLKDVERPSGIEGLYYRDVNQNCELDTNDFGLPFEETGWLWHPCMKVKNDSSFSYSYCRGFANGAYFFRCKPGRYELSLDTTYFFSAHMQTCKGNFDTTVVFDSTVRCVSGINVGFKKPIPNLSVSYPWTMNRIFPGRSFTLLCYVYDRLKSYRNEKDSLVGGTVKISFSGPIQFVSPADGAMTPDSVAGNTIYYTVEDFNDSVIKAGFNVVFLTDTTAQQDSSVCFENEVIPSQADGFSNDNKRYSCGTVSNSHDPNFKSVYPISALPNSSEWVSYTIHFQNTGNAPAEKVVIRDTLDSQFIVDSFVVLGSSHPMSTSKNNSALAFLFSNINLIDSATDAELSQGYVSYKVKLSPQLSNSSILKNTAYIFFDYNDPVVTNTCLFPIVEPKLSMGRNLKSGLSIYPNPNNGEFHINSLGADFQIEIKNYLGQVVDYQTEKLSNQTYRIKGLNPGIYTIRCSSNGLEVIELLVVQ